MTDFVAPDHSVPGNPGLDFAEDQDLVDVYNPDGSTFLQDVAALRQKHPTYEPEFPKWQKYEDCYSSEDIYKYLRRHPRESDDTFRMRQNRAYYLNYCASVIDLFVSYLFHSPIARDCGSQASEFAEFYEDCDRRGCKYAEFIKDATYDAQIYGWVGVLVDAPDVEVASEKDRKENDVRPYLTKVLPSELFDWEVDRHGAFEWIKIACIRSDRSNWKSNSDDSVEEYLIFDRQGWERWQVIANEDPEKGDRSERAVKTGEGSHNLGIVPFAVMKNCRKRRHDFYGESAIRDIADVNIALLNWSSYGDEEIANRCLNLLTMQRDNEGSAATEISHHNVLEYAEGAPPPSYLTPGSTPLELILRWIQNGKDEIYRLAKLGGSTGLLGVREATSGIAYAFEFNETNQSLANKAGFVEEAENEIHKFVAKWQGKEFDGSVVYPREFGVDDFLLELDILMKARTTLTSSTAIRQTEKRLVQKMFSSESMEFRKTVDDEIDAEEPKPVFGLGESFGNTPPGMTPQPGEKKKPGGSTDESQDTDVGREG